MKYVMFQTDSGRNVPVLFSEVLVHSEVARSVIRVFEEPAVPISAGFYNPAIHSTYGMSESMGLGSHPVDAAYIVLGDAAAMSNETMADMLFTKWKEKYA